MDQPWRIGPDDVVYEVDIDIPAFAAGDWPAVERWLGVALPSDYKGLVGPGPALKFDRELLITSPFSDGGFGLGHRIAVGSWTLATLRHEFPHHYGVALFPEPGGLLAWGFDAVGITYYWDTRDEDCERWTIFANGRPMDETPGKYFDTNLTGYLAAWPGPDPPDRPCYLTPVSCSTHSMPK